MTLIDRGPKQALHEILPQDVKQRSPLYGNEIVLSYEDAVTAIGLASAHQIAVLGFEAGEVKASGFQVVDYNGYDLKFSGDWHTFVLANNAEATRWIREHRYGQGFGYIVTSTSEKEFAKLSQRNQQ
jgi:hypothetical protein